MQLSSLTLQYKAKYDLCPCSRAKLWVGVVQEIMQRDFPVVSRVYENLWMWNLLIVCVCVPVCVYLYLGVKGDKRERHCVSVCLRLCVAMFCIDIASVNVCITYVCMVYLTVHWPVVCVHVCLIWWVPAVIWTKGGCGEVVVVMELHCLLYGHCALHTLTLISTRRAVASGT